jgi:ketopantoate hydroxymethyltransferase
MSNAVSQYAGEVKSGAFPTAKESIFMDPAVLADLEKAA